jgi:carbonic anhydrase/acetyltransferase-like protein (isoleucine patch superfamily)|nr:gamma-carbonic anhydrase 2 [Nitzschia sp. ICE-H]
MSKPSIVQRFRQTLGRALRETGQALERLGVKTASLANTKHDFYDDPVPYEDFLSRHRHQLPFLMSGRPIVHDDVAYLAPCSTLIGSVRVGPGASIWYGAILRADLCANANNEVDPWEITGRESRTTYHGGGIFIGEDSNVQDGAILTSRSDHCRIGKGVTIGHLAQIHSATVGDFSLIGMGSVVLEGAVVETEAFVAAGAVVAPGQVIKEGELWVGNPARKLRDLTPAQREKLHYQSSEYVKVADMHVGSMELGGNLSQELLEERYPSLPPGNVALADVVNEHDGDTMHESKEDRAAPTSTKGGPI